MTDDGENSAGTSPCLARETKLFEEEFIKTYEQLPVLWDTNHPDYASRYKRISANKVLLNVIRKWDDTANNFQVRRKINILRSSYRKDLRRHLASKTIGPDGEETYEYIPKSWKYYALRFLGGDVSEPKATNKSILEIDLDNTNFEDETSGDGSADEESLWQTSDALQTKNDTKSCKQSYTKNETAKKLIKQEVQDYVVDDSMLDREFEAVGANVTCKLKRMNPKQRCHAELLINKVLIKGLKNQLTEDTDLTEVYTT